MQINKINHVTTLTLSALAFLILFSYGIARPAAESLFLKAHGNEALPHVWLWLTVVMLAVAALYNHLLCRISLVPLFGAVAVFFALLPAFFIVLVKAEIPGSHYALYIWKDVYIIVLVEIFYTFLNSVFPIKLARWYYGFFGMIAALGGSVASFLVGPLAKWGGTLNSLWLVTATLLLCAALCWPLSRSALNISPSSFKNKRTHLINACQVVRQSRYLLLFLFMILVSQIVITLVDFEFNRVVEQAYPLLDERTQLMGQVYGVVNTANMVLHALTGVILRLAGIPITMSVIPVMLAFSLGAFIAIPSLICIAIVKISSKVLDYTLFRSARECLYIPLSHEERTQGKSVVDMIVNRVGKVGASFIVMGLISAGVTELVSWMGLFLILIWTILAIVITRRFRKLVSRKEELS